MGIQFRSTLAYKVIYMSETLGLGRKMKEMIKFTDIYVHRNFPPPNEAVGLLLEGGRAVVATSYCKKVSSGVELSALLDMESGQPTPQWLTPLLER